MAVMKYYIQILGENFVQVIGEGIGATEQTSNWEAFPAVYVVLNGHDVTTLNFQWHVDRANEILAEQGTQIAWGIMSRGQRVQFLRNLELHVIAAPTSGEEKGRHVPPTGARRTNKISIGNRSKNKVLDQVVRNEERGHSVLDQPRQFPSKPQQAVPQSIPRELEHNEVPHGHDESKRIHVEPTDKMLIDYINQVAAEILPKIEAEQIKSDTTNPPAPAETDNMIQLGTLDVKLAKQFCEQVKQKYSVSLVCLDLGGTDQMVHVRRVVDSRKRGQIRKAFNRLVKQSGLPERVKENAKKQADKMPTKDTCKACGGSGKNSRGGNCVCVKQRVAEEVAAGNHETVDPISI